MTDHDTHENERRFDEAFRDAYRSADAADTGAAARALERIRRQGPAPRAHGLAAWFAPRTIVLRPAFALGALVLALGLAAWAGARLGHGRAPAPAAPTLAAAGGGVAVQFVLRAPGATRVSVAGDFNGWDADATPMSRAGSGDAWTVHLTVPAGVHLYSFVLDGRDWQPDPSAPLAAEAAFGTRNSVLVAGGEAPL